MCKLSILKVCHGSMSNLNEFVRIPSFDFFNKNHAIQFLFIYYIYNGNIMLVFLNMDTFVKFI